MMKQVLGLDETSSWRTRPDPRLLALLGLHTFVCCVSLILVSRYQSYIPFSGDRLFIAVAIVVAFSPIALLFAVARFSFGYFVGFYFYSMILSFLWIAVFTIYPYDHLLAGISAAISALLFLLPALLITAPVKPFFTLSPRTFFYLLGSVLVLAVLTIAAASRYSFRLISLEHIYDFRNSLDFPGPIRYAIGIVSSVLLPFAFAGYWLLGRKILAGIALVLMLLFYPITLSKTAFFAPVWIAMLAILSRIFKARMATALSLFLPLVAGVLQTLILPATERPYSYFDKVNIRMLATPSSAMDIYNHFFSTHPLTHFCQVSFLKPLMQCPYQEQISVVMEKAYGLGNLNTSLFASEGIASVGLYLAPLVALVCGLIFALGNRLSAGLPARFVLLSAGLLPQIFLNVPMTTALLTHGTALLFLLWYVTPRAMFSPDDKASTTS